MVYYGDFMKALILLRYWQNKAYCHEQKMVSNPADATAPFDYCIETGKEEWKCKPNDRVIFGAYKNLSIGEAMIKATIESGNRHSETRTLFPDSAFIPFWRQYFWSALRMLQMSCALQYALRVVRPVNQTTKSITVQWKICLPCSWCNYFGTDCQQFS